MKNILLIMTDQQRFDTIHALGNKKIKTPVLDKLVEDSTTFTKAYTPSPVCVPARYSALTGLYCHNTGLSKNGIMPRGDVSIMETLRDAGYQTLGAGKMHFTFEGEGGMAMWGYDKRYTSEEVNGARRDDYKNYLADNGYGYVKDIHGVRSEMYYTPQPSQLPAKHHHTTWAADKTIELIDERDKEKPFFLMCGIIKPHPPFEVPAPWNKMYRSPDMDFPFVPGDAESMQTYWNRIQNRYKYKSKGRDRELERMIIAYYYGCISFIDYNVGRIFDKLREDNIIDDTLIIYTSDHGEMLGDYNCYGKRGFLDPAARIPMIVRWPGKEQGEKRTEPVSLVDIIPTILEYTGVKSDLKYDGNNLFSEEYNRPVVSQLGSGNIGMYMLVDETHKYFYSAPDNKEWLLDTVADPKETHNGAEDMIYDEKTKEMREKLVEILKHTKDDGAVEKNHFKKMKKPNDYKSEDEGLLYQDGVGSIPEIEGYTD